MRGDGERDTDWRLRGDRETGRKVETGRKEDRETQQTVMLY